MRFSKTDYGVQVRLFGWEYIFASIACNLFKVKSVFWVSRGYLKNPNLSWVKKVKYLDELEILSYDLREISHVERFSNLKSLTLETSSEEKINWTKLQKIESVLMDGHLFKNFTNNSGSLSSLYLLTCKEKNFQKLNTFPNLKKLRLSEPPIESIEDMQLPNLNHFGLYHAEQLKDLEGIQSCAKLEWLEISACRKLSNLYKISELKNLKRLELEGLGAIDSLDFCLKLTELEEIYLWETKILDGKIRRLLDLQNLKIFRFHDRKTYDITDEQAQEYLAAKLE
jgi:Leucine-rich repeat (LRR) protein